MRAVVGLAAGAAVAVAAAALLGEYRFSGPSAFASAAMVGLFVSEAVVTLGRQAGAGPAVAAGLLSAAGLLGAAWTSSGHHLDDLAPSGWAAVAGGAAVAAVRAWWPGRARGSRRRQRRTP